MSENEEVRRQFEAGVRQWPNYSERTLARDGRHTEYYGNPVVQGAWEGYQAALSSPAVVALVEALRKSNEALEAIAGEMTVGDRFTNAGQFLLDAIPMCTAALAPFTTGAGHVE